AATKNVRKRCVVDAPAATATRPATPAVRARDPVQIVHRRYGRRKSTRRPAAPTIIAARGPSVIPAKMKTSDEIETSIPSPLGPAGVSRTLSLSAMSATATSAHTAETLPRPYPVLTRATARAPAPAAKAPA